MSASEGPTPTESRHPDPVEPPTVQTCPLSRSRRPGPPRIVSAVDHALESHQEGPSPLSAGRRSMTGHSINGRVEAVATIVGATSGVPSGDDLGEVGVDVSRLASTYQLVQSHAIQTRQRLRAEPGVCHEAGATGMRLHPAQNLDHLAQPCLGLWRPHPRRSRKRVLTKPQGARDLRLGSPQSTGDQRWREHLILDEFLGWQCQKR